MSEAYKIAIIVGFTGSVCLIAFVVITRLYKSWVAPWKRVLEPLGGTARPRYGLNTMVEATLPLNDDTTLELQQWGTSNAGRAYGQILVTLRNPSWSIPAFLIGEDAWASAHARWALSLPKTQGLGAHVSRPLNQGRSSDEAVAATLLGRFAGELDSLRVYLGFGQGNWVRVFVPGMVRTERDAPKLQALIQFARHWATHIEAMRKQG